MNYCGKLHYPTNNKFCCSRHQINKPKSLTDRFQYPINEKDNSFYNDKNICNCTCRHASRALCFVYNNQ